MRSIPNLTSVNKTGRTENRKGFCPNQSDVRRLWYVKRKFQAFTPGQEGSLRERATPYFNAYFISDKLSDDHIVDRKNA